VPASSGSSSLRRIFSLDYVTFKVNALWLFETSVAIYPSTQHKITEDLNVELQSYTAEEKK
jgi:hypothetical protein